MVQNISQQTPNNYESQTSIFFESNSTQCTFNKQLEFEQSNDCYSKIKENEHLKIDIDGVPIN